MNEVIPIQKAPHDHFRVHEYVRECIELAFEQPENVVYDNCVFLMSVHGDELRSTLETQASHVNLYIRNAVWMLSSVCVNLQLLDHDAANVIEDIMLDAEDLEMDDSYEPTGSYIAPRPELGIVN